MANKSQYLAHGTFLVTFPVNKDIRYRVKEIEDAFRGVAAGQAASTNVGDSAPPNIPRYTIQSGSKQINISQVTAQLDMEFSEKPFPLQSGMPIVLKNMEKFWDGVCALFPPEQMLELGAVVSVNMPTKRPREEIMAELMQAYSRIEPWGEVASANFAFGVKNREKCIFNNLNIGMYEMRQLKMQAPFNGTMTVNLADLAVDEYGVEVKFDVNTKPFAFAKKLHDRSSGNFLLAELQSFISDHGPRYLEEEK